MSVFLQNVRMRYGYQILHIYGFVYLTSIMDLYSQKIIAWELSTTLEAVYVADCVKKAKQNRRIKHPLLIHTDRGSQYGSKIFLEKTKEMTNNYSRKAYPWDNACIESFHALIKREWLRRFRIFDYQHAYKLVFEYIETFHDTKRSHSHYGYFSPNEYEKDYSSSLEKEAVRLAE